MKTLLLSCLLIGLVNISAAHADTAKLTAFQNIESHAVSADEIKSVQGGFIFFPVFFLGELLPQPHINPSPVYPVPRGTAVKGGQMIKEQAARTPLALMRLTR